MKTKVKIVLCCIILICSCRTNKSSENVNTKTEISSDRDEKKSSKVNKQVKEWWKDDSLIFGMGFNKFMDEVFNFHQGTFVMYALVQDPRKPVYNAKTGKIMGYPFYSVSDPQSHFNLFVGAHPFLAVEKNGEYDAIQQTEFKRHLFINTDVLSTFHIVGLNAVLKSKLLPNVDLMKLTSNVRRRVLLNECFHLKYGDENISLSEHELLSDCLSAYDDGTDSWLLFFANRSGGVIEKIVESQISSVEGYEKIDNFNQELIKSYLKKSNKDAITTTELKRMYAKMLFEMQNNISTDKSAQITIISENFSDMIGYLFQQLGVEALKQIQKTHFEKFLEFEKNSL